MSLIRTALTAPLRAMKENTPKTNFIPLPTKRRIMFCRLAILRIWDFCDATTPINSIGAMIHLVESFQRMSEHNKQSNFIIPNETMYELYLAHLRASKGIKYDQRHSYTNAINDVYVYIDKCVGSNLDSLTVMEKFSKALFYGGRNVLHKRGVFTCGGDAPTWNTYSKIIVDPPTI